MAIVALEVPQGVVQYLNQLDVPGAKTPTNEMHVTIVQIDRPLNTVEVATISGIVAEAVQMIAAFSVTVDHVSSFPANDHGVPIICPIKSEGLMLLHQMITESLDRRGIEFSKRFPVYRPHTTLSWATQTFEPMSLVQPITWTATYAAMWPTREGAFQSVRFGLKRRVRSR